MHMAILLAQENGAGPALGIFGIGAGIVILFWIWMMIDALVNEPTPEQKILWFLVTFFLPVIGSLAYLFIRKLARPQGATAAPATWRRP